MKKSLLSTLAIVALASVSFAQFELGGGLIDLRINGTIPSTSSLGGHQCNVNQVATIAVNETAGPGIQRQFAMLIDFAGLSAGAFVIPGLGTIDLAAPAVVINSIIPSSALDLLAVTNFSLSFQFTTANCVALVGPAVQAIGLDLAGPILPYTLTQAGQLISTGSSSTTYPSVGDDTFFTYVPVCTPTITYAGTTYPSCIIGSNGMVTFTTGTGDFTPTAPEFFNGFRPIATVGTNPGVASVWNDWFPSSNTTDNIVVTDFGNGDLNVAYNNQSHWASLLPAGNWNVTFGAATDTVTINAGGYIDGNASDAAGIIGVTDGTNVAGGVDTNFDISANLGWVSSGAGPESIMEAYNPGAGILFDVASVSFLHTGGFNWVMF